MELTDSATRGGSTRRIVAAAGFDLTIIPSVEFRQVGLGCGRPIQVPSTLSRSALDRSPATVQLPLRLTWSDSGRRYDLRFRRHRASFYEIVAHEGQPADVLAYVDGAGAEQPPDD